MKPSNHFRADRSAAVLLLSNLAIIAAAVALKWDIRDVMWVYWGQSVIIGCFTCLRILDLKQFSTEGVRMNNRPLEPTRQTQRQAAGFFALHYGFFHFVYLIFLLVLATPDSGTPLLGIGLCLLAFLLSHAFSFWHNRQRDRNRKPRIGCIMAFPYGRIFPMHLTIIFGGFLGADSAGALVLFLLLKTAADVVMHMVEHADRDGASLPPSDTPGED